MSDIVDGISAVVATGRPGFIVAADQIADLADALEKRLIEHEKAAELEAEAAQLEARLAEIRAQLPKPVTTRRNPRATTDNKAIRAWAARQGIHINDRGRVPADIVAAYEKATTTGQVP